MRIGLATLALLAGCDQVWGLSREQDPVDAATCFGKYGDGGAGLFRLCLDGPPADSYDVPASIDTDDQPPPPCTHVVVQADEAKTEVCVIAAREIHARVGTTLHGRRPVVLLATETLTVDAGAVLDAGSHRGGLVGAHAMAAACTPSQGTNAPGGGGGGAGGGFQGPGGDGGNGAGAGIGAMGGAAVAVGVVRAGCAGSKGGGGTSAGGGVGGSGGGALYLIAGVKLEVAGTINASGESGAGGTKSNVGGAGGGGGGGGGSGGMIGLDAPSITLAEGARLVANGGGGGGGGGSGAGGNTPGMDGGEAMVIGPTGFPFKGAGGTAGTPGGGAGGDGSALIGALRGANATGGGAGGGGGGRGFIFAYTTKLEDLGAKISPLLEK